MHRRQFISTACSAAIGGIIGNARRCLASPAVTRGAAREWAADLAIIGGGLGGCAAALAAARRGLKVVMTEETDWIGGQLTSQAVPPDEHRWIEHHGCTRSYRELRGRIRGHYQRNYPLTDEARAREHLNPGNGSVSRLCCEPRAALAALHELLAPHISAGRITILHDHRVASADRAGDRVRAVQSRNLQTGDRHTITAPFFIDATETGELLPLAGVEYVTGFESQRETNEERAPADAQPHNMQAFTCCFAVEYRPGEDHTLERPAEYAFWRDYVPALRPPWPGRLLSWQMSNPVTLEPRLLGFDPSGATLKGLLNLWLYRRIIDRRNFDDGTYPGDVTLVNWPQNDYWLGNLFEVPAEESARHLARGKQLSLSLLYWMQTEAPRPDGGTGWPGLRLRPDLLGSADGLAKTPYIRESRRIRAEFTVVDQHISIDARVKLTGEKAQEVTAAAFADSVGIGSYRIDLHPSSGGDNYIDVGSLPFQIPLGALIPRRVENVLAGCKNIGTTHITNGCYRLHPVEWNIGESAGSLVAFCTDRKQFPRAVRNDRELLADFQRTLENQGVELAWPAT